MKKQIKESENGLSFIKPFSEVEYSSKLNFDNSINELLNEIPGNLITIITKFIDDYYGIFDEVWKDLHNKLVQLKNDRSEFKIHYHFLKCEVFEEFENLMGYILKKVDAGFNGKIIIVDSMLKTIINISGNSNNKNIYVSKKKIIEDIKNVLNRYIAGLACIVENNAKQFKCVTDKNSNGVFYQNAANEIKIRLENELKYCRTSNANIARRFEVVYDEYKNKFNGKLKKKQFYEITYSILKKQVPYLGKVTYEQLYSESTKIKSRDYHKSIN
jgi:hypothetical protein